MKYVMFVVLAVAAAGLAGCNTVKGVGQDISGGADTVHGWIN